MCDRGSVVSLSRCECILQQHEIEFERGLEGQRRSPSDSTCVLFRPNRFHQQRAPSELNYSLPRKPPEFLLDTDGDANDMSNQHQIPSEILYLLKSVKSVSLGRSVLVELTCSLSRVFGHFERPIFLELCKYLESKVVLAGSYLFRIGDADDSFYVVQKGLLHVFITDEVRPCTRIRIDDRCSSETSSTYDQRMCRRRHGLLLVEYDRRDDGK